MALTSPEEVRRRLTALRRRFDGAEADACVIFGRPNTLYLSGFAGTSSILLVTARRALLLTDFRYIERARREVRGMDVEQCSRNGFDDIGRLASRMRLRRIAFEGSLPYADYLRLRRAVRPARLTRADLCEDARRAKSDWEVDRLRRAQRVAERVFEDLLGEVEPGLTERQVRNRLMRLIDDAGLEGASFEPIVAAGANSSIPHAEAGPRRLRRNDIVTIDMGVRREGYCSDMTRTFFLGSPTRAMREVYQIVLDAQARALDAVRAGQQGCDVDAVAREWISEAGYGPAFGHGLGHGLGVEIHEAPSLSPASKDTLADGMCVTVEPGIYLEGRFGVRIEDSVIVRPDGCENLTRADKALVTL